MYKLFIIPLLFVVTVDTSAKLVELENHELSEQVAAAGLGLAINDFSLESDVAGFNGKTSTTELKIEFLTSDAAYAQIAGSSFDEESLTISNLRIGKHSTANFGGSYVPVQGVDLGSYDDPVSLSVLPVTNAIDVDGNTTNNRSALFLCFTGLNCNEAKNLTITNGAAENIFTDSATSSEGMDLQAKLQFNVIDYTGKTGDVLYKKDPVVNAGNAGTFSFFQTKQDLWLGVENLKLGGTWVSLWADAGKGASLALRLKASADAIYLNGSQKAGTTHGLFDSGKGAKLSDVTIDLQLGRPFYQPINISNNLSVDFETETLISGLSLEVAPITNIASVYNSFYESNKPRDTGFSPTDDGVAYTNVPNTIRVRDVNLNGQSLGGVLVEGVQIQYLKVSTRDVF